MKVKVEKTPKSAASKLVDIKKSKSDIQKAKKPKKELKAAATKLTASSVAAPLIFAEKKVLSVKRKAKAKKSGTSITVKTEPQPIKEEPVEAAETKPPVKPKAKAAPSVATNEKRPEEVANGSTDLKEETKPVVKPEPTKKSAKGGKRYRIKKWRPKYNKRKQKDGEKKEEKIMNVKEPREVGPVASEVAESTLALLPEQLVTAANFKVLFEHVQKKARGEETNRLFGDDFKYALQITSVKIPSVPSRNVRIGLPHSTLRKEDDVCLIVRDPMRGSRVPYQGTVDHWQKKLQELGVSGVTQIIPFRQLKDDYGAYEMKRKLVHRFSRFLVDARISGHVFAFLGKLFIARVKNPIPVKLDNEAEVKYQIEKALHCETYRQTNTGKQTSIKFACDWMPVEQAVENGMAVVEKLKTVHPGGWLNIQSLHLISACTVSTSFLLYVSDIDPNLIPIPVKKGPRTEFIEKQKAKMEAATGGKYKISKDGIVMAVKKSTKTPTKMPSITPTKTLKPQIPKKKAVKMEVDVKTEKDQVNQVKQEVKDEEKIKQEKIDDEEQEDNVVSDEDMSDDQEYPSDVDEDEDDDDDDDDDEMDDDEDDDGDDDN